MKTKNIAFSVLLIALAIAACKKDDPAPALQQHDTVYAFDTYQWGKVLYQNPNITASADSAEVRHVILRATGDWSTDNKIICKGLVQECFKPLFEYSAKMQGEGRLNFESTEPADSLWLVQHGYEVPAPPTPPLAASTQTWKFGTQTWSDAIQVPECNKERFENSYTEPQCRSYTYEGKTFYYYNWPHVDANKNTMCPGAWRVPSKEDFEALVETLGGNPPTAAATLISAWGYGGEAWYPADVSSYAEYWSSTVYSSSSQHAHGLYYASGRLNADGGSYKLQGFQVRCVR
jgi:hypothetical protein